MYGTAAGAGAGQAIFTDDVSLQVFMDHLKRLVRLQFLRMLLPCAHMPCAGCRGSDKLDCRSRLRIYLCYCCLIECYALGIFRVYCVLLSFHGSSLMLHNLE